MNDLWLGASWMHTASGGRFFPQAPEPTDIHIHDIAHALASICRFGGHTITPYSVAQHSVLVSEICDPEDALWGLLHDATEAYLGDVIAPIKKAPGMLWYLDTEYEVQWAVCRRFNLGPDMPESVRRADLVALATERRDVLVARPESWDGMPEPLEERIVPWPWKKAERAFLSRFVELGGHYAE